MCVHHLQVFLLDHLHNSTLKYHTNHLNRTLFALILATYLLLPHNGIITLELCVMLFIVLTTFWIASPYLVLTMWCLVMDKVCLSLLLVLLLFNIHTNHTSHLTLHNLLLVPKITKNIIYVSQFAGITMCTLSSIPIQIALWNHKLLLKSYYNVFS